MTNRYKTRLQETKCLEESSSTLTLPADLFIDILLKLPVKTMMQCKSVCHSWRDLLSTPNFANLYFSKAKVPNSLLFFCSCSGKKTKRYYCDFHSLRSSTDINNGGMLSVPTKFNLPISAYRGRVVGSSNGLLCLREINFCYKNKLFICNPITGEYVEIPEPKVERGWHASEPIGFFYTPQNKHCKILMQRKRKSPGNFPGSGQIFTLGSNSWRNIDIPQDPHLHNLTQAVPLNGALYWISARDNHYISSFDLENEQARSIAVPDQIDMSISSLAGSGNVLFIYDNQYPEFNIWLMKDDGDKEKWKHYTVKRSPNSHYRPITIKEEDGKEDANILLLQNSKTLISYDPKTKESRALYDQILDRPFLYLLRRFLYLHTPTFVSLKDILIGEPYKILNVWKRKRNSTINSLEF